MTHKLLLAPLLLTALGLSHAQTFEVSIIRSLARMSKEPLGSNRYGAPINDDTTFRNGSSYGFRLSLNPHTYYGYDLGFFRTRVGLRTHVYDVAEATRTQVETKVRIDQAFFNFMMYTMPKGEWWRPYLTVGMQTAKHGNPRVVGWQGVSTRNFGVNYGAGIKFKFGKHAIVRLDARDYFTGKPYNLQFDELSAAAGGVVRQQEASVGLAIGF